jgi:hypothetical protein
VHGIALSAVLDYFGALETARSAQDGMYVGASPVLIYCGDLTKKTCRAASDISLRFVLLWCCKNTARRAGCGISGPPVCFLGLGRKHNAQGGLCMKSAVLIILELWKQRAGRPAGAFPFLMHLLHCGALTKKARRAASDCSL